MNVSMNIKAACLNYFNDNVRADSFYSGLPRQSTRLTAARTRCTLSGQPGSVHRFSLTTVSVVGSQATSSMKSLQPKNENDPFITYRSCHALFVDLFIRVCSITCLPRSFFLSAFRSRDSVGDRQINFENL